MNHDQFHMIVLNKYLKKQQIPTKYLKTVIFSHVVSCDEGRKDGEFNVISGHIFTNIHRKIKTRFFFAISSLTL